MQDVGFIGLGNMGIAMARNLMKAGFQLTVYNRTAEKAAPLVALGAKSVQTPGETAQPGGIVVTMLTDDAVLEAVTLGENGIGDRLGAGGIHLSTSTVSPAIAERLAEYHRAHGAEYVASPVFGKPDAAEAAKLWICTSGAAAARERVLPLQNAMGQGVYPFGDNPASAHVVKLAGNFLLGAAIEAMAEAFTLAEKNGIERTAVHDLFSQTIFASPVYKNYGRMIADQNYLPVGAAPALIRKDMRLVLQAAQARDLPMPLASLVHDRLTTLVAQGVDDIDWAGFARLVSEDGGL